VTILLYIFDQMRYVSFNGGYLLHTRVLAKDVSGSKQRLTAAGWILRRMAALLVGSVSESSPRSELLLVCFRSRFDPEVLVMLKSSIWIGVVLMGTLAMLPRQISAVNEQAAPANDFAKKFVIVSREIQDNRHSDILKKVELKRIGNRDFLVGEYCVNENKGIAKDWEGVLLWVPVENIVDMMVFTDESKAWSLVDGNGPLTAVR